RREGRFRVLELALANMGNVTELLQRGRVSVTLARSRRVFARLVAAPREPLPHSRGLAEIDYRGRLRGVFAARVLVDPAGPGGSGRWTRSNSTSPAVIALPLRLFGRPLKVTRLVAAPRLTATT